MASGAGKSAAFMLLILNLILYLIIIIIAGWAVNHGIERAHKMGKFRIVFCFLCFFRYNKNNIDSKIIMISTSPRKGSMYAALPSNQGGSPYHMALYIFQVYAKNRSQRI